MTSWTFRFSPPPQRWMSDVSTAFSRRSGRLRNELSHWRRVIFAKAPARLTHGAGHVYRHPEPWPTPHVAWCVATFSDAMPARLRTDWDHPRSVVSTRLLRADSHGCDTEKRGDAVEDVPV